MRVWTVSNQKGGVSKTVLATNLAVEGSKSGLKVLIIDLDPQQSATKWWEAREAEEPMLIKSPYSQLKENLEAAQKQGYQLVVIDTAGREGLKHSEAIEEATFVVVPCQPSLDDCRSALPTVDLIKRNEKNFCFIITRCPSTGEDFQEAKASLSALGIVCNTPTIERKCYKRAYAENMSVSEYDPKDKAAQETKAIYDWVVAKEDRLQQANMTEVEA